MTSVSSRLAASRVRWSGLWQRAHRHQHVSAGFVLALAVFLYLMPALVGGRQLSDSAVLYRVAPWKAYSTPQVLPYSNPELSDLAVDGVPWLLYARSGIRAGVLPAWNPLVLAGTPFYANPQSRVLSPLDIPEWLLPLNLALAFTAALRLWLAAFGAYLLARRLRLGFAPGLLAGATFGFSAYGVIYLSYAMSNVFALLPWALIYADRIAARPQVRDAVWLALILAVAMLGGYPAGAADVAAASGAYCLIVVCARRHAFAPALTSLAFLVGAGVVALFVSAPALLPAAIDSAGTGLAAARTNAGYVVPPSGLSSFLFPDWWGRPTGLYFGSSPFGGPVDYAIRVFYGGTVALLLGLAAVLNRRGWRRQLPFLALLLIALDVIFALGPFHWLLAHLPPFDSFDNARIPAIVDLCIAILGAFGLHELLIGDRRALRLTRALAGLGVCLGLAVVVAIHPSLHDLRLTLNHFRTGHAWQNDNVIRLTSVGWFLIIAGGVGCVLLARTYLSPMWLAVMTLALVALDLGHFVQDYNPMPPSSATAAFTPASVRFLKQHLGPGRFAATNFALPPDSAMSYGLRDAEGYDPPEPSSSFLALWQLLNPQQGAAGYFTMATVTPQGRRVIDLLGVRYVLTDPADPPPTSTGMPVVYRGADATIYADPTAVDQAFVPPQVITVNRPPQALAQVESPGFSARADAVVESRRGQIGAARGAVTVSHDTPTQVTLSAQLHRGGLVVLDNTAHRGWSVTVDGHPTTPLTVDTVLQGVDVPAGSHRVVWSYMVPGLRAGLIVSALGLITLVLAGFATYRRAGP